jgi:hypothetical protein
MKRLSFFCLAGTLAASTCFAPAPAAGTPESRLTGTIVSARGNVMLLETNAGKQVIVDLTEARSNGRVGVIAAHVPVVVYGTSLPDGTFHCTRTGHAARGAAGQGNP